MSWKDREKESIRARDPERSRTRETGESPSGRSETRTSCKVKRGGEKGNKSTRMIRARGDDMAARQTVTVG